MEKLKNAIKLAYQWLSKEGGMLHFLACYAMMLTFAPFGFGWASAITWAVAIGKEICDIARKSNNFQQALNDIIRDAIGWGCASVVWLIATI
jgi:hypothetical protein